jgi:hypothetical protein
MSPRKRFDPRSALPGSPFLTHIALRKDRVQKGAFPFTVPRLLPTLALELSAPVTLLVGEKGTGTSTLLEAIAWSVGFGAQRGNRGQSYTENADGHALGRCCSHSGRNDFQSRCGQMRRVRTRRLITSRSQAGPMESAQGLSPIRRGYSGFRCIRCKERFPQICPK